MIRTHRTTRESARLRLASDPDVEASRGDCDAYLRTGDGDSIKWPEGVTEITIRALSEDDLHAAESDAGILDPLGSMAWREVLEIGARVLGEVRDGLSALDDDDDAGRRAIVAGLDEAQARAMSSALEHWDDAKVRAHQRAKAWAHRRRDGMLARGLLAMHGDAGDGKRWDDYTRAQLPDALMGIEPLAVRRAIVNEIAAHIDRVTTLGDLGKARSPSRSGSPQAACTPGSATTATPRPEQLGATAG